MKKNNVRQAVRASVMRSINRAAVLDIIRGNTQISRSRIAGILKVSMPTVMRIVDELLEEDLVCENGSKEASGGRPSKMLEFNGAAYAVIGVDLSGTDMLGVVADLSGTIQNELTVPIVWGNAEENETRLISLIGKLLIAPRPENQHIRGIGVGVPSITYPESGKVMWAPSLGWKDISLKRVLNDHFDYPVVVQNDVNTAVLGEYGFGAGRGYQNMVYISVDTGIGAGIIINGILYQGQNQSAGEIGYLLPGVQFLNKNFQKFGALESFASGTSIAQRAREHLTETGGLQKEGDFSLIDAVVSAARVKEAWAVQILDDVANHLSLALAAVNVLLDPDVIVLGGRVSRSVDGLADMISERLEGTMPSTPNLVTSSLGNYAIVMGIINLVLRDTTSNLIVKTL